MDICSFKRFCLGLRSLTRRLSSTADRTSACIPANKQASLPLFARNTPNNKDPFVSQGLVGHGCTLDTGNLWIGDM